MMKYTEQAPKPELQSIIKNFWRFEVTSDSGKDSNAPISHEIMPEETVSLVFINQPFASGLRMLGPQLKKIQVPVFHNSVFLGVRFQPWIVLDAVFEDKIKLRNANLEADEFLKKSTLNFDPKLLKPGLDSFATLEEAVVRFVKGNTVREDPLTRYICLELQIGERIEKIVEEIPLSVRPIQKRFKQWTGLTMNEYRNILRLQKTVREIFYDQQNKLDHIYYQGYYDQSHFINDFKKYMNKPLDEFLSYVQTIQH